MKEPLEKFLFAFLRIVLCFISSSVVIYILIKVKLIPKKSADNAYAKPISEFIDRYGKTAIIILFLIGFYRIADIVMGVVANIFYLEKGFNVIETNNFNDGSTIASIADMDNLIFQGKVDESEVEKLDIGMELIMTIGAIEDHEFTAILEYISPKGVQEEGAIKFEIEAAVKTDTNFFIRAGYSANANVVLDKVSDVLAIDERLISFEEGKN